MHSLLVTGRLLSRAFWNGIANVSTATDPNIHKKTEPQLISAVCGFSKERRIQRLIKGQFGDDAWFTAKYKTADVLAVADGVGGWRAYGIDPGEFSLHLMKTCERLVKLGRFTPSNPSELLAKSYYELLHHKKAILGSSTACVVILNKENSTLYTSNIGDSGFMVVRRGKVIRKSEEQQHYFNTPFQLSLPPPGYRQEVLSDRPDAAMTDNIPVEDGDVILVATDGVFDNLPQTLIVNELIKIQGERCAGRLQMVANSIAWMAKNLSYDENFVSPFAESAFANGINTIGGKPDDITVLLATVAI
ncbi:protein phosphatase PTC7 homolog isoform X2 [Diorhabda carinulata]|uniref:protein phosphatase PTC7 homolog isoform X2 n=1 Tax=Diorhabda sublineata TaxID=1163346 RepID=UPI0024E092C5|nr:protein phosphatase PTC7 homolog isoform X2 [Diorhabda sublineata]XP_057662305.1 protein phosphatase PTC7 homolog isoform X2 [Diorhabda carinulata]